MIIRRRHSIANYSVGGQARAFISLNGNLKGFIRSDSRKACKLSAQLKGLSTSVVQIVIVWSSRNRKCSSS
jgi:hypothetical protein